MPSIAEIRQKYPQYQDMSDTDLAGALHQKFYSDMPAEEFNAKLGIEKPEPASAPAAEPSHGDGRGVLRRVDDMVRGIADTATFGFADEIAAGLGAVTGMGSAGGNYDANLEAERERDSEGGLERLGGQVAGVFTSPLATAKTVLGAAGQGAVAGGVYGFGSGDGDVTERSKSAVAGGLVGGAAGGAVKKVANAIGNRLAAKAIPSNAQLRKQAERAYNLAENAGVIFKPEGVRALASNIVSDLADFGFDPALQPGVAAVIRRFQGLDGQNVTLKGLDVLRRVAGNAASVKDNPSQATIARKIIDRIDDFTTNASEADVLMGNAKQGAAALKEARDLWGRLRRSEMVDTAAAKADLRASSTGSGGNADNAVRQNVRRLVENPRGMSSAERAAAERVVRGTKPQNALRLAGKLAPTGVVSGVLSGGAGYGLAGPAGLALPLVGAGAKALADRMTVKNVEKLSQIIRSGGKTAQDMGNLARGGQLDLPAIERVEVAAKSLGISVSELAAVLREVATAEPR